MLTHKSSCQICCEGEILGIALTLFFFSFFLLLFFAVYVFTVMLLVTAVENSLCRLFELTE